MVRKITTKNHGLLIVEQESTYPKNINKKILSNIEEVY
jgi:hypothetical protein